LSTPLASALNRDRWVVLAGLAALMVVAWVYMVQEARELSLSGMCQCAGMKMSGPDLHAWSAVSLLALGFMWVEMMVAMMLPSATPMILVFAQLHRQHRENHQPYVSTAVFVLGYLCAWAGFSAMAAAAQWGLHGAALLSPKMVSSSRMLGAALLIAAGIFQWTPLKNACLRHCRSPLNFLLNEWRDGRLGALIMGLRQGSYCIGCCWLLMVLLFVAGVMNLWWIGLLTLFVLAEKVAPPAWRLGQMAGAILIGWGILMLTGHVPAQG
jgi:predicted metal-binding membrane protein